MPGSPGNEPFPSSRSPHDPLRPDFRPLRDDATRIAGWILTGAGLAEALRGAPLLGAFLVAAALFLRAVCPMRKVITTATGQPCAATMTDQTRVITATGPACVAAATPVGGTTDSGGTDELDATPQSGAGKFAETPVIRPAALNRRQRFNEEEERFPMVPVGPLSESAPGEGRTDFLETASRISMRMGSSNNIKRMANNFVTEAMEIFDFKACALWIFADSGDLSFVISRVPSDPSRDGIRLSDEVPPDAIEELLECGSAGSPVPDRLCMTGKSAWAGVFSLSVEGCLLGVFQAEGTAAPDPDGAELLSGLLNQFSLVFLNIRLARQITLISEDISKRDFEFVTLDVFSRITNRSTDTDRIIEFTLEFVSRALDLTAVTLLVEKAGKAVMTKDRGQEGHLRILKEWWKSSPEYGTGDGGCRCGPISRKFARRLADQPGSSPRGAGRMSAVLRGGETMTLIFFSRCPELEPRSRKFLETVAKQVQVAVDSSSTLASLDRKVRLLNLIYAVCGAMSERFSFEERMERVVDFLKVFLDARGCGIFVLEGSSDTKTVRPFVSTNFFSDPGEENHDSFLAELQSFPSDSEGFIPRGGMADGFFVSALRHDDRPGGFLVVDGGPGFSGSGARDFEVVRAVSVLISQMVADHHKNLEVAGLKELLSSVLDTVDDAILVIDHQGRVLSANRAVSRIFGQDSPVSSRELLADFPGAVNFLEGVLEELNRPGEDLRASRDAALAQGVCGSGEAPFLSRSGERALEISAAPMGGESLVVTVRDVSERWTMQRELRRIERLAALGEMAAGMAHEIRNPLGGIKVLASFLASSLSGDPQKKEMADTILGGVAEVDSRISALLGYARPEKPEISSQDLNEMVLKGLEIYMAEGASRGIIFDLTGISPPGSIRVLADPSKFGQILGNVLRNAIQAQPDGGCITLWMAGPSSLKTKEAGMPLRASVIVEDAGPGMDSGTLARIYDPFFTTKADGTGLGMAITQKMILAMGGDIKVESSPGDGTRVTIFLPVDPSSSGISGIMGQPEGDKSI